MSVRTLGYANIDLAPGGVEARSCILGGAYDPLVLDGNVPDIVPAIGRRRQPSSGVG